MDTQTTSIESRLTRLILTELRRLSQLTTWKSIRAIGSDWALIAVLWFLAVQSQHPAVWAVAACLIAGRQHALLILMHDGAHFRVHPSRLTNDLLSNWLLAYPFFASTQGYRNNHLAHHSYLNTDDDPDWVRKLANADWDLPKTKLIVLGMLLRDFLGGGVADQIRALRDIRARGIKAEGPQARPWERPLFYAAIALVLTISQAWTAFIFLWLVPVFMILPVLLRIRSIAEHFGLPGETATNSSRNYAGPWWEGMLFTPHNVGYHLDHHLFPSVPFYNLPELNRFLNQYPEYRDAAYHNSSLFNPFRNSVLNDITSVEKKETVLNQKRRAAQAIPSPREIPVIGSTLKFVKNPIGFLMNLHRRFGDLSRFKLNFRNYYFLTNPEHIQNFFVRDYANFDKSTIIVRLRRLIGSGLLTCPFADHKRQRRLVQPAFTASSLNAYGEKMPAIINAHLSRWPSTDHSLDLTAEMDQLILKIAAGVLFGDDSGIETKAMEREIERFHRTLFSPLRTMASAFVPSALSSRMMGVNHTRRYFERITDQMIQRGIKNGFSGKNLLSVMIQSTLAEGQPSDRVLKQLTTQIINMILASVETVASTLNWTWYLLSQNPEVQTRLQEEVDKVFESQTPTAGKLTGLTYTEAVIKESLRLFPAVWSTSRVALNDYQIGARTIPKGSIVIVSPFVTQRDPRFFETPHLFQPERWMTDESSNRPEFSYFPFGGGPRMCIGMGFAMLELKLIIATMAQRWKLDLAPGQKVELHPLVTIRPKKHIIMQALRRPTPLSVFQEPHYA